MIKEFRKTFKIELPVPILELVAFRIQTGTRPLHRRLETHLILQDRWLIQTVYRRLGEQQGLGILEKTMVFEAECEWQKAYPESIQIEYLRKPYCVSYHFENSDPGVTEIFLTLLVLIEFDLEFVQPLQRNRAAWQEASSQLMEQGGANHKTDPLDLVMIDKRLRALEARFGFQK